MLFGVEEEKENPDQKQINDLKERLNKVALVISPLMDQDFLSPYLSKRIEPNPGFSEYTETRYLDAWAKLLNIQNPCSAVARLSEESLAVTFNDTTKNFKKSQENALKIIGYALESYEQNQDTNLVLTAVLLFNVSFGGLFRKELGIAVKTVKSVENWEDFYQKHSENILSRSLEEKAEDFTEIKRNLLKLDEHGLLSFSIQKIENQDKLHAEIAIAIYIQNQELEDAYFYIGISKLSCHICHKILDSWSFGYRGSHGKLYINGYNFPDSLSVDFLKDLLEEVNWYIGENWEDSGRRVIEYDRIFYSNRLPEAAYPSDSEYWDESKEEESFERQDVEVMGNVPVVQNEYCAWDNICEIQ